MPAYIHAIATATPAYRYRQLEICEAMVQMLRLNGEESVHLEALYRATGIQYRHSVLPDFFPTETPVLYHSADKQQPDTVERNNFYLRNAPLLASEACQKVLNSYPASNITHLITVSCTGIGAPGPDIALIELLGLPKEVHRLAINFMGCYAAITALKQAEAIVSANPDASVLIASVELCSLHFQRTTSPDLLMANALFADGAAAVIVRGNADPMRPTFLIQDFFCDLLPDGASDMSWMPGHFGFDMRLSSYIPDLLRGGVHALTHRVRSAFNTANQEDVHYAIHPGGRRILQVLEEVLGTQKQHLEHSYHILREYGNMSSPTVLFVLQRLSQALEQKASYRAPVVSFAFGPGLTVESMLLEYRSSK
jgi:predicted naringenin-chalcone synthase